MSLATLSPRERRTILIGLLIGLPILLFKFVIGPYRSALTDARDQLASQRDLLSRELTMLAEADRYPLAYRAADSALLRVTPRLFDEPDDVLASAQLASYLAGQALSNRVFLHEANSRTASRPAEGIRALEVEIQAESDLEGLIRFLEAIERGPKLLVVDRVEITKGERAAERGRPAMPLLLLSATVRGFGVTDVTGAARATLGQPEDDR